MAVTIGPADWWIASPSTTNGLAISCPVGTTLPDCSRIICKAGGTAWIIAPSFTVINGTQWAGGQYNTTQVGNKCCIFEWPALNTRLIQCGFNPCDWFVPSSAQFSNPGYVCRSLWGFSPSCSYWSSTENNSTSAFIVNFTFCFSCAANKCICVEGPTRDVLAFRCVTY